MTYGNEGSRMNMLYVKVSFNHVHSQNSEIYSHIQLRETT